MSFLKQHLKNSCPDCLQEYNGSSHVCASSAVVKSPAAVPAPEALFNMPMLRTWVLAFDHAEGFPQNSDAIAEIKNFGAAAKYFKKQSVKKYDQMYARWAHLCILYDNFKHLKQLKSKTSLTMLKKGIDSTWNNADPVPPAFVTFVKWESEDSKTKNYFPKDIDPKTISKDTLEAPWKKAKEYLQVLTTPLGYNAYKKAKDKQQQEVITNAIKKLWISIQNKLAAKIGKSKKRAGHILEYLNLKPADIYLLQEVDKTMYGHLQNKFGGSYTFVWDGGDLAIVYKTAIFSGHDEVHRDPDSTKKSQGGQYFQVLDLTLEGNEKLRIINCHLDSKSDNRKIWGDANFQIKGEKDKKKQQRQRQAAQNIKTFKGWLNPKTKENIKSFILGGDFNCTVAEANAEFFKVLGFPLPSSTGSTTDTNQPYCPSKINNFSSDHLAVNGKAVNGKAVNGKAVNGIWDDIGTPYIKEGGKAVEKPDYHSSRKMRDITSEQPSKIGEKIDKTIDHIFCKGTFTRALNITTFNVLAGSKRKWSDGFVLGPE